MPSHRIKDKVAAQLEASERVCAALALEHKILRSTVDVLEAEVANPKPDGLDCKQYPSLFAFLGEARLARSVAACVYASSQEWNQGTLTCARTLTQSHAHTLSFTLTRANTRANTCKHTRKRMQTHARARSLLMMMMMRDAHTHPMIRVTQRLLTLFL
jgi:hypothetical protein